MQRMKENYESRSRTFLTRRIPVIIRLDGKAFHTYTKGLDKPFDQGLVEDMQQTAIYVCENIQGAKAAYTQSDEINILITDYDKLTTEAWFNYNVQKITSISASLATSKFNQLRLKRVVKNFISTTNLSGFKYSEFYKIPLANFDSRAFSIPREDVNNYFVARQRDAVKNSVAMLAQSLYSHSELHKKNGSEMQEMCFQKGHNWNNLHYSLKRGSLILKNTYVNGRIDIPFKEEFINGDIWYQPECIDSMYPDKRGRLLELNQNEWGVVETPTFSKSKTIEKLLK